jgi:hypothetical protein
MVCERLGENLQRRQELASGQTKQTTETTEIGVTANAEDAFVERAALIQVGAGVPRSWAEGFATLDLARPPVGFPEERWRRLIDDGGRFLDEWGSTAAELGWSAQDVFGLHPGEPASRLDAMGLAALIDGGQVTAVTAVSATIRAASSHELVYLRRVNDIAVAAWELVASLG